MQHCNALTSAIRIYIQVEGTFAPSHYPNPSPGLKLTHKLNLQELIEARTMWQWSIVSPDQTEPFYRSGKRSVFLIDSLDVLCLSDADVKKTISPKCGPAQFGGSRFIIKIKDHDRAISMSNHAKGNEVT